VLVAKMGFEKVELHLHPFFDSYSIDSVVDVMDDKCVSVLGLESLNKHIFPKVRKLAENTGYNFVGADNHAAVISKENKNYYFLNAIELCTSDNFHVLVFGSDKVKPFESVHSTIDVALSDDAFIVLDHPFVDSESVSKELGFCGESFLKSVCVRHSGDVALEWNAYCKPWVRKFLGGSDVNKKVEDLSSSLKAAGFNVPVVPDSDVHARNKRLLSAMGSSNVVADLDCSSGKNLVSSLKSRIFSGNYISNKGYVSMPHFVEAFGVPILFQGYFKNARG
jgi:hypothetical protein